MLNAASFSTNSAQVPLISADNFVGYKTAEAAHADGKMPPP
jgi:hypothetical protein